MSGSGDHWSMGVKAKGSNILDSFILSGLFGSWGQLPSRVLRFSSLTFSPSFVFLIASKALAPDLSPCLFLIRFFSTLSPSFSLTFSFSSQAVLCWIQIDFFTLNSSSFSINLSISSDSSSSCFKRSSYSSLWLESKMGSVW